MSDSTCTATRKDGQPCTLPALPDGDVCFAHRAAADRNRTSQTAGGKATSKAARAVKHLPPELADIPALLRRLIDEVHAGTTAARNAEVIGGLASRLIELFTFADARGEAREIEARLSQLESQLGVASGAGGRR